MLEAFAVVQVFFAGTNGAADLLIGRIDQAHMAGARTVTGFTCNAVNFLLTKRSRARHHRTAAAADLQLAIVAFSSVDRASGAAATIGQEKVVHASNAFAARRAGKAVAAAGACCTRPRQCSANTQPRRFPFNLQRM